MPLRHLRSLHHRRSLCHRRPLRHRRSLRSLRGLRRPGPPLCGRSLRRHVHVSRMPLGRSLVSLELPLSRGDELRCPRLLGGSSGSAGLVGGSRPIRC